MLSEEEVLRRRTVVLVFTDLSRLFRGRLGADPITEREGRDLTFRELEVTAFRDIPACRGGGPFLMVDLGSGRLVGVHVA